MKAIALIFALLIGTSFAQDRSRITVIVNETVELEATSFVYEVKMGGSFSSLFESFGSMEDDYEEDYSELDFNEVSFEELQEILNKNKFTYTLSESVNFDIKSTPAKESVLVNIIDIKELGRLKETLIDLEGISGSIKEVKYEDISSKYESINKSLLENAKTQASAMLNGTGKSLGSVFSIDQVEESKDMLDGFWGEYQKKIMSSAFGMGNDNQLVKKVDISYRYSFELN